MAEQPPRYTFHPLERRGLLCGLQASQLGAVLAGFTAAVAVVRAVRGPAGMLAAGCVVGATGLAALWPLCGQPVGSWAVVAARWAARRPGEPLLSDEPLAGRVLAATDAGRLRPPHPRPAQRPTPCRRPQRGGGTAPAGVEILDVGPRPGRDRLGVIVDRRSGALAAVLPVTGGPFSLLDAAEQARRLDAWRAVLCMLARPGTPLRRVQWLERSGPAAAGPAPAGFDGLAALASGAGPAAARNSYAEVVAGVAPATQIHDVWLVLAVGGTPLGVRLGARRGAPPALTGRGALDALLREIRLLEGQLRNADLRAGCPLPVETLGELLGAAHHLDGAASGRPGRRPWPMAADETWSRLRLDGGWHATFWISEWPRVEVPPGFLAPLLLGGGRRSVSVVMAPVPAGRAIREARSARTADIADEELRTKAGFLPSARRGREAEGVMRREAELADGHAEYRFSGYVTVSAADPAGLEAAAVEAQHAAQAAHVELVRLYGRQAEAYTWTLPLARGLR